MDADKEITCVGCGGTFADIDGVVHRYMESSAGCWSTYGEILEREYSNALYFSVHQLTVDAYAVQHPGTPSPQSIQLVALHLISLCVILEKAWAPNKATQVIQEAAKYKKIFYWLTPPDNRGALTVIDVMRAKTPAEHNALVRAWAESVWRAWAAHHETVRAWLAEIKL